MYLVTILKTEIQTNAYPVNLANDGLAGMMPVFKRKKDAVACAKKNYGAEVMQIERVSKKGLTP